MTTMILRFVVMLEAAIFVWIMVANNVAAEDDEVVIEILKPPPADCERKSKRYDQITMHYVGTLTKTGKKFDASFDRNEPYDFQLGAGQVILGWDEGLVDMCVGEKRKLIIPPSKAYGDTGAGKVVPPKASLTYEVELLNITEGTPPPNIYKEIDLDGDLLISKAELSDYVMKHNKGPFERAQHDKLINDIFGHEDKDKDGFISHEEFGGPKHDEL